MQVLLKADDEGESGDQLKTGHGDSVRTLNPWGGKTKKGCDPIPVLPFGLEDRPRIFSLEPP